VSDAREPILRTLVPGQPTIVRSIILLPQCALDELVARHKGCGVDSLGRPVTVSGAWL